MSESITRPWASAAPDGSRVTVPERDGESVGVDASSLLEPQAESHASCSVCIASFGVRSSLKRPQCSLPLRLRCILKQKILTKFLVACME